MSEIDKRTIRIDQGSSLKLPHVRNAVMYDAANPNTYMMVLQNGSKEVQEVSPGSISQATIDIQEHMVQGDYHAAFTMAHKSINASIERKTKPNLWHVQLMRIAAMQTGSERIYVETLNALEQRGVLDAQEAEYLPVGYTVTERMRQDMRDESITDGEDPARSRIWTELEIHNISPIDKTAVRVGPKRS